LLKNGLFLKNGLESWHGGINYFSKLAKWFGGYLHWGWKGPIPVKFSIN